MSALLEIRDLHVDLLIDGVPRPVIHETTVGVDAGEALGLVGESGAGKSMTVRAIMRLLPLGASTRGEILFDGADVLAFDREALRRFLASDVAMIFQDPTTHINPVRKIGDFLTEALVTNNGVSPAAAQETVTGILKDVGITEHLGQSVDISKITLKDESGAPVRLENYFSKGRPVVLSTRNGGAPAH